MLLRIHAHEAAASAAVAVDIDEAGSQVVSAAVDDPVSLGCFAGAVAEDLAVLFQEPSPGKQPIRQNERRVGKQFCHK